MLSSEVTSIQNILFDILSYSKPAIFVQLLVVFNVNGLNAVVSLTNGLDTDSALYASTGILLLEEH